MYFGGPTGGPRGNDGFDATGIFERVSGCDNGDKGQRSSYNRNLEKLLRGVSKFITLDRGARGDILAEVLLTLERR